MSDSTATPDRDHWDQPAQPAPAWLRMVDDAAIFPPGNAALDTALTDHVTRRREPWAEVVDTFVISDHRLAELRDLVPGDADPVGLSIVIGAGAGGLAPATSTAQRLDGMSLSGLEVALRDPADLVGNARRVIAALDQALDLGVLDEDVTLSVELPQGQPSSGWLAAADELAAREIRLKFRTGGVDAELFPSADELGAWITAALDRESPFKCTAGLHHAVRHRDRETGFEHHGFLNVLLATRVCLDGGDPVEVLREESAEALVTLARELGDDTLSRTRRWFTGFGSCSIDDPVEDLHELGIWTGVAR
ncbi:hypothetical protein BJ980_001751 [Nocardioides daedukensis]|uniref:Methylmalonyl-CoA mutase domain-containing protein n=1 Tax=Nocardioides daedukensis TaxID=634462 RepID=A0A7Y9UNR5_9ACTN|nr:hypothetical protein [Nocardioides daedukensis]NYG58828.1 hypothetical protein [Nocardioides daedukensis]